MGGNLPTTELNLSLIGGMSETKAGNKKRTNLYKYAHD